MILIVLLMSVTSQNVNEGVSNKPNKRNTIKTQKLLIYQIIICKALINSAKFVFGFVSLPCFRHKKTVLIKKQRTKKCEHQ